MINLDKKNQKFLITGGTGFIGSKLVKEILKDDHKITILTRNKKLLQQKSEINYIDNLDIEMNFDIIINLCGEAIFQRWTDGVKKKIYSSRIDITKKLAQSINNSKTPPRLVISGSAIGYYGISQDQVFAEDSKIEDQKLFSQNLCKDWESSASSIVKKSRLVIIRTGVVIGKGGGMMKRILLPFKLGLGGKIGSGKQYLSWISLDDVILAINHIINKDDVAGAINLTAPKAVTNQDFSRTLAKILNRPCFFCMPAFFAKIVFGQMADELLLNGQNVAPKKLLQSGYSFKIKNVQEALKESCLK